MRTAKLFQLAADNPSGLRFRDLCRLAEAFGFVFRRQKGSHRVYTREGISQIMVFQDVHGAAKTYQVRQLLACIKLNRLSLEGGEHE